jgi:hypothetical protein
MMIADNEIISYHNHLRYQRSIEIASVLEAADREAVGLDGVAPVALPMARGEVAKPSGGSRGLRGRPKVGVRTEAGEAAAVAAVARRQRSKSTRIRTIP